VYQRIVQIDPFDPEANAALGRSAMQMNQPADAVRAFKAVVALKPVDPAMAYTDLAESYFKSGNRAEARKQTGGVFNIGGYNILFNTHVGGNHFNHLHIGLGRIIGRPA
jgi:predicted Zn-dependent protease